MEATESPNKDTVGTTTPTSSLLYFQSFLLGVGLLTPFNMVLNLIPFLADSYGWPEVAYYTSLCLTYPSIFVQFVLLPCGQRFSSRTRIRGSLLCGAAALLLLGTVAPASRTLGITLMLLGGACTAVLEGSLFGWLSQFPNPNYSQAAMAGVALAGVLATLLQLLLRALLPGRHSVAAGVFTVVGVAVLAACLAVHSRMAAPVAVVVVAGIEPNSDSHSSIKSEERPPPKGNEEPPWVKGQWPEPRDDWEHSGIITAHPVPGGLCGTPGLHAALLRQLLLPISSLILTFVCTFMVFPGLIASVPYKGGGGFSSLGEPGEWFIVQLLVFGVSDVVGRGLTSCSRVAPRPAWLLAYAAARFTLVPLISACVCSGGSAAFGDVAFTALVGLLGGTGGHLASLLMMHSPKAVATVERETAGLVLVASLHVGIVAGSNLALFFEGAGPCTPT